MACQKPTRSDNPFIWFPVDEFGEGLTFDEYNNIVVEPNFVLKHFREQLIKFMAIDAMSDISMIDFVLKNLFYRKIFSDYWHPMPCFFNNLASKIAHLANLPLCNNIVNTLPMGINGDRHRLVPSSILKIIGIPADVYQEDIFYFGKKISVKTFYDFSVFAFREQNLCLVTSKDALQALFFGFIEG